MKLANFVNGKWVEGKGDGTALIDPVLGTQLARASTAGIDIGGALDYARTKGGPALRAMSFAERAEILGKLADALGANRDKYYETALANSGNTKGDAAVDIDGGIGTLKFIARLFGSLGDNHNLRDGKFDRLAKDETFQSMHLAVPLPGVAIHINAFNFPSWGLWAKAAVALMSGVPVMTKPATATALLTHQMVKDAVDSGVLPDGALNIICGSARDLLDHVTGSDAIAFTGSADTACQLRATPAMIAANTRFNVEADSLNLSLLGPDSGPDSPEFSLFVREVRREMTVKAGQKCTAIRRAFVPAALLDKVSEALAADIGKVVTGNPRNETVTMGPIVSKAQQKSVVDGIEVLKKDAKVVASGNSDFVDGDAKTGCFVAPTLLRCDDPKGAKVVHDVEVFGPVCTLMPYGSNDEAYALAARGGGSLAASVFTGDDSFANKAALALAPHHGRVLMVNDAIGKSQTGHGIVMPQCVHGGPGRAGGGEELGGLRALRFYHHRVAIQGDKARLEALAEGAAEIAF
jgi:3,4-dehydroadipyl-CoA semialdehyde dehydrogenase